MSCRVNAANTDIGRTSYTAVKIFFYRFQIRILSPPQYANPTLSLTRTFQDLSLLYCVPEIHRNFLCYADYKQTDKRRSKQYRPLPVAELKTPWSNRMRLYIGLYSRLKTYLFHRSFTIDFLPASGMTPRTLRLDRFF